MKRELIEGAGGTPSKETAMQRVFQEIMQIAREKLREALQHDAVAPEAWDADRWEDAVRQLTRELGETCLQVWTEERAKHA